MKRKGAFQKNRNSKKNDHEKLTKKQCQFDVEGVIEMQGEKIEKESKASLKRKRGKRRRKSEKVRKYVFEAVAKYLFDTDSETEFEKILQQWESEKSRKVVIKNENRKSNKK